ncbi:MAG: DUF4147 domain-containing protein [Anaerolineales bacterium]|nr:DUF4147 domain-containing protein [Anaerolineales bacterium]
MNFDLQQQLEASLGKGSWSRKVARILQASLQGVIPDQLISKSLARQGDRLIFPEEVSVDLTRIGNLFIAAVGKAAVPMSLACARILEDQPLRGIVISKHDPQEASELRHFGLDVYSGGHPLPDQNSLLVGRKLINLLEKAGANDLVLVLLSGGGSSLLSYPVPDLELEDLIHVQELLLHSGADITAVNTVRKHLSRIKGGQLAKAAFPARVITLALSDVIGDRLDSIASGPTVGDPTTFGDALEVLDRFQLKSRIPQSALNYLEAGNEGRAPETPKPGDFRFAQNRAYLIGSNHTALIAARKQAEREGFRTEILPAFLQGEAREAGLKCGVLLRKMALENQPLPRPACLIAGGETTVTIPDPDRSGLGGRNLEVALGAVQAANGLPAAALITLATDGEDGPSDAAGALVTGDSLRRGADAGLDPADYLREHNSYPFFQRLGDLLITGSTQTNVNDLTFLFTFQEGSR